MGVNLFVEGKPLPVVIHVKLHRVVSDNRDLFEVARALRDVDAVLARDWPRLWNSYSLRSRREVHILAFRVESPAEFRIICGPRVACGFHRCSGWLQEHQGQHW